MAKQILSFDAEGVAARGGAVHLNVIDLWLAEQLFNRWLEAPVGHVRLRNQPPSPGLGFQRSRTSSKLFWKSAIAGVLRTIISVDINRAWLGQRFDAREPIVSE